MSITLGVPKERGPGEQRVALTPQVAQKLKEQGIHIQIEKEAGLAAGYPDDAYGSIPRIEKAADLWATSDLIVKVAAPSAEERQLARKGSSLIALLGTLSPTDIEDFVTNELTTFGLEFIPRISRAQAMDVLSSQATVAGYQGALLAAEQSQKFFPMLTTAAGTIRPAQCLVIGAGVAGLQAIATAKRLGAVVTAYDIRPAAREQVESLGAKMLDLGIDAEGEGGYARSLTAEEQAQVAERLAEYLPQADAVICTAAIPGRPAPKIISTKMVSSMKAGAVIIDIAAETGGNCELTQPGEKIVHEDVIIDGPIQLASRMAHHASEMFSKNIFNFLQLMHQEGELAPDWDDPIIAGSMLTRDGKKAERLLNSEKSA